MVKFYNSLQARLTISFVLLIVVITGLTYMYTYNEAKTALKDTIKDELKQIADMAASQFTGENLQKFESLKIGDDETKNHMDLVNMLYNFRKNNKDISEFYVMKVEDKKAYFWVDDWVIDNREEMTVIGEEYQDYDEKLLDCLDGETVSSDDFFTDEWGTFLTGYAPIKDESGKVIAVVAVDMRVNVVQAKIDFIGSLIYYVIGAAILAAALIIMFFSVTIVKDINKLTKVANKSSNGESNAELPVIKAKNEIYELNEGLKSVVAAMQFLQEKVEEQDKKTVKTPTKKPTKNKGGK